MDPHTALFQHHRPRQTLPDVDTQRRLLERFLQALQQPELPTLRALFAEDAISVADDVYTPARTECSAEELVDLNMAVILINSWNRIVIPSRAEAGSYQPAKH